MLEIIVTNQIWFNQIEWYKSEKKNLLFIITLLEKVNLTEEYIEGKNSLIYIHENWHEFLKLKMKYNFFYCILETIFKDEI